MAYWHCYYHIVWATKQRQPLIDAPLEPLIFEAIRHKSGSMGCKLLAVNGTEDHIHLAVCIPPKFAIAEWVKQAKGYSAREVNVQWPDRDTRFYWQSSYGVLTFGQKNLAMVLAYIDNQKEHHRNNTLFAYLERSEDH